jgi:hypothetical protein
MAPESTLTSIEATPFPAPKPNPKCSRATIKRCCAAHAIRIEAIPAKRSNQLLCAAQAALAALQFEPKSQKICLTPTPPTL